MNRATHVDQSMALIKQAMERTSRLAFAKQAGLAESTLRKIGTEGWNPKSEVLKTCEQTARIIIATWRKRHRGA